MNNDTAQEMRSATIGQFKEISVTMLQSIPSALTFEMAMWIISHKAELIAHIQGYFPNPEDLANPIKQWESFYQKAFSLMVDFSEVKIPERTEEQKKEFTRLIIVPQGLTNNQVYRVCETCFPCSRYIEDLDNEVPTNERDPKNGAYAIWVRDVAEADKIHRDKSADMIKKEGLKTETILERMLHELKYFLETGKHLDLNSWTLCSGSRDRGGDILCSRWDNLKFKVSWFSPGSWSGYLRSREVISYS